MTSTFQQPNQPANSTSENASAVQSVKTPAMFTEDALVSLLPQTLPQPVKSSTRVPLTQVKRQALATNPFQAVPVSQWTSPEPMAPSAEDEDTADELPEPLSLTMVGLTQATMTTLNPTLMANIQETIAELKAHPLLGYMIRQSETPAAATPQQQQDGYRMQPYIA